MINPEGGRGEVHDGDFVVRFAQSDQQANSLCLHRLVEDISVMGTGTHPEIAATDQTRPIATTTAITMDVRIASPLRPELSEVGFAYFSPKQCDVGYNRLTPRGANTLGSSRRERPLRKLTLRSSDAWGPSDVGAPASGVDHTPEGGGQPDIGSAHRWLWLNLSKSP